MEETFKNGSNFENIDVNSLPDPKKLHDHINNMLGGNLGRLAREIAEDTRKILVWIWRMQNR